MRKAVGLGALVLGCLVCGSLCMGEAVGGDPMEFSLSVGGSFTDNRDAVEVNEQDNFDLLVTPRVDIFADSERTILNVYYAPTYRYRSDPAPDQDDSEFYHSGGINLDHRVARRLKLKLDDAIHYSEDPAVEDGGTRIGEERLFLLNEAKATVVAEVTRQSHLEVYGANKIKRYDEDAFAELLDEDRMDVGGRLWQRLQRTRAVYVDGRASAYGYEDPNGVQRDFDLVTAVAGIENVFHQNLRGSLAFGWQWQDFDDPGLDEQDEPFAQATLQGTLSPATRVTAQVTHAIRDADAFPYASQQYTEYFGRLEWDASEMVTLAAYGKLRNGDYDEAAPSTALGVEGVLAGGDEDAVVAGVELAYAMDDQTAIRLIQHYEDVESDVTTDFTRNTTSLVLTRHF
jgi:hypothetical protein